MQDSDRGSKVLNERETFRLILEQNLPQNEVWSNNRHSLDRGQLPCEEDVYWYCGYVGKIFFASNKMLDSLTLRNVALLV